MPDQLIGHIAGLKVREDILDHEVDTCPTCDTPCEIGYGLAGGGFGVYGFCSTCEKVVWKCIDSEE